ncbi:similar to Saccharomyces cerevisiae YHR115C DMA1 Protein involved in ubiquitin ligation [Maudiozyma saulgeensis]|uniref:RING-type E3 ubiquitin transferase n=1 Tax=Maudiozyma saulgeensis TaxID=1789683 RepID=A0A1X7QZS1_9SACH|nr:similar to Saccharomyces cerevisiae YHR115C DMA1 Protein involved in ubiquitin ligation [Kazachstania saulgeensis]
MYHFNPTNQSSTSGSQRAGNAFSAFGISQTSGAATTTHDSGDETPHDQGPLPIALSLTGNNSNSASSNNVAGVLHSSVAAMTTSNNQSTNSTTAATNHLLNVNNAPHGTAATAAAAAAAASASVAATGTTSFTGTAAAADLAIGNSNSDSSANSKNVRHYVYSADQPNADSLLHLDLPESTTLPPKLESKELRKLKDKNGLFSLRLTPFIDNVSTTNQGLYFDPIVRTAGPGSQLVIGRYTERVREAISKLPENYHPVVFKSKVISRTHGCFKVDSQGNWFIKDVKSSSGTFLNHQRLSPASTLSKDIPLHDGDVLQLGMDFRGGTEEIYRCVKMRVELNKSWKRKANAFNKEALNKIKELQKLTNGGIDEEDCSICLSKIKPCQAIFISPCSHSWHFHCVRRLVMSSYPQFVCPNCRAACDLEATIESSDSEDALSDSEEEQIQENINNNSNSIHESNNDGINNPKRAGQLDPSFRLANNSIHHDNNNNIIQNSQLDLNVLDSLGVQLDDPKNDVDMESRE